MKAFIVIGMEFYRLRRVKVTWVMLAVMAFAGVMLNAFLWIAGHPDAAASLGLLGQKATISFGGQDLGWPALAAVLREMAGLGGMLLASFILAWLFGRDYQLGTVKVLMALPVPRWYHAAAKFTVSLAWLAVLLAALWLAASAGAAVLGLPGFAWGAALESLPGMLAVGAVGWAAAAPVAWVAVASRGIFAPLGYGVGTLLVATLFGNLGWGPYLPWSVALIVSGAGGTGIEAGPASAAVVAATAAAGFGLVVGRYRRADVLQ